jgi:ferredoxin
VSTVANTPAADSAFLPKDGLQSLVELLQREGFTVIGPRLEQGAVVYGELHSVEDLPRGWTDEQAPGSYRLRPGDPDRFFGFAAGPQSWKPFLFPPLETVHTAERKAGGQWEMHTPAGPTPRYAFFGVRACDLAAIRIQDRVFVEGPYVDPQYQARREQALVIAVNCTGASASCFCTSMHTGPRCTSGFDLALTEIDQGFLIEIGSPAGETLLGKLPTRPAAADEQAAGASARQRAIDQIERRFDTTDIHDLLLDNLDHPQWQNVAARCLSCANCTLVCPTCFCHSVSEVAELSGERVERRRQWDSCFNLDFSYMNGGIVRNQIRSRYRQWLTHKLATWIDQFGASGCVGCGRCITWCPVGIDLTAEVAAIRATATPREGAAT